jgi:uncharacterized protein (TIGR02284 family)
MMNTDTTCATLNELIEVLEDGKNFYQEAATKVSRPVLRALFERMATAKAAIESDLRTAVMARGEQPATTGSFAGAMQKAYAEVRAKLSSDKNHAYVAQLEQFEDRILYAFQHAAQESDDAEVRTIAQRYMLQVSRDHDQMRDLKHAKAA